MIDSLLLVGRPTGMGTLIEAVLEQSRSARMVSRPEEAWQVREPVSLIVVLQHWPDEYAPDEIRRLLETFPLSRFMVVQGAWCASDRRTRQHWPAAFCVPVREAVQRLNRELEVSEGSRAPLPWTAGLDEIFAFDHGE